MSSCLDLLTDACTGLDVNVKKMFGGHGFFAPNGGMFAAVVSDDEAVLKLVHGPVRDELIALGGRPWVYHARDKDMTMAEWIVVPDAFYDDQEVFRAWATRAFRAVPPKSAGKKKKASRKAPKRATARSRPRR